MHCLPSSSAIPFLPNAFASSFAASSSSCGIRRSSISIDRHLAPERAEDRGELAADDPAAEDGEPRAAPSSARAGRSSRRRAPSRGPGSAAGSGTSPSRRSPSVNVDVLAALDRDRVRVAERALALHPLDAVRLEERGDAAGHLRDDGGLPLVRRREVELGLAHRDAELRERVARLVQEVRGLHPRLRRDAADAQAGAAELRAPPRCRRRSRRAERRGSPPCSRRARRPGLRRRTSSPRSYRRQNAWRVKLEGIHHVTCITGDAPANVEFYAGTLGLRLVKKTVNQDDPTVYHLFYADERGSAGADITFFEYPGAPRGRAGRRDGAPRSSSASPPRRRSTSGPSGRTASASFGSVLIHDPEGLALELVVDDSGDEPLIAEHPEIPRELALRGFAGVRAYSSDYGRSAMFLWGLGFTPGLGGARREARRLLRLRRRPRGARPVRAPARCTTSRGRRSRRSTRPGARRCALARRAADAGDRPLLLPLDLLPRAERRAVRDRDARARASPPTSRSRRSASGSRCRRTTSSCAPSSRSA